MGSYLAYTEYKESGIEWLGKVPSHWTCGIKLIYLSEEKRHSFVNGPFGSDLLTSELTDEGIPVIYSGDVKSGKFSRKSDKYVSPDKAKQLNFCRVDPGDLLLAKVGDPPGDAAMYPVDELSGIVTQDVVRIKVDQEKASPSYLCHFMNSKVGNYIVRLISVEATRGRFSLGDFKSIKFSVPPLEEQRSIARFLDYKTAQINALIAKKETLLKKLAEKRTTLISQAVTKGCDRTVPMKDSGIEWPGEIPAHWEPIRLKFLIRHIEGGLSPQCYGYPPSEGEWGVLKTGCVNGGIFNPQASKTLPETIEPPPELEVQKGDVLMSRASGSIDLVGSVAIVSEQPTARLLLSDKTFRLNLNLSVCDANFFVLAMGSSMVRQQIHQVISGAEGLANNIAQSSIRELIVSLPPFSEQQKISQFLENKISEAENQMQKVSQAIQTLKEYRTALITNAVTGKIDVRDVMLEPEPVEAA